MGQGRYSVVAYATKFAEEYRQKIVSAKAAAGEKLRHPTVLASFANRDTKDSRIFETLRQYSRPGMFFFELPTGESASVVNSAIRELKAEIQRNEAQVNIRRVNISLIVTADSDEACEEAGRLLRGLFEEDFPIVQLSLFILLSESNLQDDFELRSAASLRMLQQLDTFQREEPIFNLLWLFSDRDENDIVSEDNLQKNLATIASLHFLRQEDSNFEDSLQQKSQDMNRALLVTAGLAWLEKPHKEIAFAVFRRVFSLLIKPGANRDDTKVSVESLLEHPAVQAAVGLPLSEAKLAEDMESIAEEDIKPRSLHRKNIRELEAMLFGDRARLFYEANFASAGMEDFKLELVMEEVREHVGREGLSAAAAYRKDYLPKAIAEIEARIAGYAQEIELRYQELHYQKLFQGTQGAREAIVAVYTVRSQMERLQRLLEVMRELQKELDSFCARCEELIQILTEAEELLQKETIPGLHIPEYYEGVVDQLMVLMLDKCREYIPIYPLIDAGIDILAERIAAFIVEHIMSQPELCLSFEEDLIARSALSPHAYDRDFTNKNELYSSLLKEADRQAALAISLQGYDDLVYERYYLGDMDSPCMEYAREYPQNGINEAVYFMEDTAGFKLLRMAGGFVPEDLARYRAMEGYLRENG